MRQIGSLQFYKCANSPGIIFENVNSPTINVMKCLKAVKGKSRGRFVGLRVQVAVSIETRETITRGIFVVCSGGFCPGQEGMVRWKVDENSPRVKLLRLDLVGIREVPSGAINSEIVVEVATSLKKQVYDHLQV